MGDDQSEDQSMVCSLADRDQNFETLPSNLKYKTPSKIVLESDDEEEPPAYNAKKKYVFFAFFFFVRMIAATTHTRTLFINEFTS